jgi:ABC-2 type transport system permease protein
MEGGAVSEGRATVAVRHDLAHVPLAPPSKTSGLLEVFRRRYLLRLMVKREIQARYAGTVFGLAWSYINPFTRFLTFYFVFGVVLKRGLNVSDFAIHLFAGMVLVNYFTETVTSGTKSILSNRGVVSKMAMPREMFPATSMLVSLWHTFPQVVILTIACVVFGLHGAGPAWHPDLVGFGAALLGFAIVLVYGTGLGLMFCCVNVIFRDFARIVQTFINMIPFVVPMMYPYNLITTRFGGGIAHTLYMLNPIAEAVMLMQRGFWYTLCSPVCTFDPATGKPVDLPEFTSDLFPRGFIMLALGLVFLLFGQWVFSRLEKNIPERL